MTFKDEEIDAFLPKELKRTTEVPSQDHPVWLNRGPLTRSAEASPPDSLWREMERSCPPVFFERQSVPHVANSAESR